MLDAALAVIAGSSVLKKRYCLKLIYVGTGGISGGDVKWTPDAGT